MFLWCISVAVLSSVFFHRRKDEDLILASAINMCLILYATVLISRLGRGCQFPWRFGSFVLLVLIGSLVFYDVQKNKSWEKSSVASFLRDVGLLEPLEKFAIVVRHYTLAALSWCQEKSPYYFGLVQKYVGPYAKIAWRYTYLLFGYLADIMANVGAFVRVKAPVVLDTIEQYVPGLSSSVELYSLKAWEALKMYSVLIWELCKAYLHVVFSWLETNVFVGDYSFANLGKYSLEVYSVLSVHANNVYQWISQQLKVILP